MAFQQGLSGLNVSAKAIESTSNNIANSSTVGFKSSSAHFTDVYAASLTGASANQVGIGASIGTIFQQFTQGNVTATSNPLDLAINGQGFYRMDNNGAISYTRNGQFHTDSDGFLVNDQAFKISGYPANSAGAIVPSSPAPIQLSASDLAPNVTANVNANLNLDSRSVVPTAAFNPNDPTTYNSSTAITAFDSQGNALTYTMYFRKIANNSWDLYTNDLGTGVVSKIPGAGTGVGGNVTTGTLPTSNFLADSASFTVDGTLVTLNANYVNTAGVVAAVQSQLGGNYGVASTGSGQLSITSNTSLTPPTLAAFNGNVDGNGTTLADFVTVGGASTAGSVPSMTFSAAGALVSPAATVTQANTNPLSNGATLANFQVGFTGTTQFGNTFSVNSLTQDGYTTGRLAGISVSQDGTIQGRYTNGQARALGQIVLANFTNPNGLTPLGNNQFSETASSGAPLLGSAGSGRLGVIQAAAVEESNTDLTAELVNLITQQRNYQANAQSIKTQDQVLSTLVNLR